MRIVRQKIDRYKLDQIIYDYVQQTYKLEDAYETPDEFQILTQWWFKLLCYLFFWVFYIPVIWYKYKMKEYREYMINLVNVHINIQDYRAILKKLKYFDGLTLAKEEPNPTLIQMRNSAVSAFPRRSRIDREIWSDIYEISIFKNYKLKTQHVHIDYRYYRYVKDARGRKVRKTYYGTWKNSLATFYTNAFMNEDNFNLNINNTRVGEKLLLENSNFNRANLVYTNNKIKASMLLTMLYQEVVVDNNFNIQMSMYDNVIYAFNHKFESLYTVQPFPFELSDIKAGKDHIEAIIRNIFENNINALIDAFEPYLLLPVW